MVKPKWIWILIMIMGESIGLASCFRPIQPVRLASGVEGGYYSQLSEQVRRSGATTVGLIVKPIPSQGAEQNLQRLLDREVDFALVQLDVASKAMQTGQVRAVVVLAREYVHVITRSDTAIQNPQDLAGKRIEMGIPGSGTYFTAQQLLRHTQIPFQPSQSELNNALTKLQQRQVDAAIYVGGIGASESLRLRLRKDPNFHFVGFTPTLTNYLMTQYPGSYQPVTIPAGTYSLVPPLPVQDTLTLATPTVLITHADVNYRQVALMTWAILSTSRQFAPFYPELARSDPKELMQQGLFYVHPATQEVFDQGDPREAWVRYLNDNNDLQAGLLLLAGSSFIGLVWRQLRQERSKRLLESTKTRVAELQKLLPDEVKAAIVGVEELQQENRFLFVEGKISPDVYEQLTRKTQTLEDQCRSLLEQQRKQLVMNTLLLIDEWQANLQTDPDSAMTKLTHIKQQYREMLLSDQVDIGAYIELVELTLLSLMTLTPKSHQPTLVFDQERLSPT